MFRSRVSVREGEFTSCVGGLCSNGCAGESFRSIGYLSFESCVGPLLVPLNYLYHVLLFIAILAHTSNFRIS